jgi:hypothetical protein
LAELRQQTTGWITTVQDSASDAFGSAAETFASFTSSFSENTSGLRESLSQATTGLGDSLSDGLGTLRESANSVETPSWLTDLTNRLKSVGTKSSEGKDEGGKENPRMEEPKSDGRGPELAAAVSAAGALAAGQKQEDETEQKPPMGECEYDPILFWPLTTAVRHNATFRPSWSHQKAYRNSVHSSLH